MAGGPYKRTNAWQIKWRQDDAWQSESFALEHEAHYFKYLVEQAGNRWPTGWIKGHGFVTASDVAHLLASQLDQATDSRKDASGQPSAGSSLRRTN
jgi:hypothetical protein